MWLQIEKKVLTSGVKTVSIQIHGNELMNDLVLTVSVIAEKGRTGIGSPVSRLRLNKDSNHFSTADGKVVIGASELVVLHHQFTGTVEEIKKAAYAYVDGILAMATQSL